MLNAGQQSAITKEVLCRYVTSGGDVTEDIGGDLRRQHVLFDAGQQSAVTEEVLSGHVTSSSDVTKDIGGDFGG